MPEFSRDAIEALRQPLEDSVITIARAKGSVAYPADFLPVGTANPCPCGYFDSSRQCSCSAAAITRYHRKISGPILDRIDLYVSVEAVDHKRLLQKTESEDDEAIRQRVIVARRIQKDRFKNNTATNAKMTNEQIRKLAKLDSKAEELLNHAATQLDLSARGYMRTIKVARTIADLARSFDIRIEHVTEALQYRKHTAGVE